MQLILINRPELLGREATDHLLPSPDLCLLLNENPDWDTLGESRGLAAPGELHLADMMGEVWTIMLFLC